jgi:hypothetical protein
MIKIQKLSDLAPTLGFSEFDFYSGYQSSFSSSELGQLHSAIPFSDLASRLGLRNSSVGRTNYFSPEGKLALMFLKSYTGLSDSLLIADLNSNIHYQLFCGVRINPLSPLTNFKIVSQIRCEIASFLDIDSLQQVLASYWKPYMENLSVLMTDATCYESHLRYPTSIKILWEAIEWLYPRMCAAYKELGLRKPRTKYDKQVLRYHSYSKNRKPRKNHRRVLQRSLLHLLNKLIGFTDQALSSTLAEVHPGKGFKKRYAVIKKVYHQQRMHFEGKKVKHIIVSIDKDYIRPIVRGKETKAVEFGAKVNTIQIDGINFIEHLSFEAFNEGVRLPNCISKQQQLFHRRVKQVGADCIYATNKNRKFCSARKIATSFVRKGRAGKDEEQNKLMRSILSKERATRMEGSFGTEKEFYTLRKVKARTKETEILWIFFGIHTANAVRMIPKIAKKWIRNMA